MLFRSVETQCADMNIDMYENFERFCWVLFNQEMTGLRTLTVKQSADTITTQYYVSQYIMTYGVTSAFSLSSMPYFIWMIFSACNWSYLFNDKMIESVVSLYWNKIMTELYKLS